MNEVEMHENGWGPPIRWRDVVPSAEAQLEAEVREQVRAERRARRVEAMKQARNALIDAYGEDIYADGTVVSFKKRFKCGSHEYVFAAVKAAGKWFTSGMAIGQGQGLEWDDFIERLVNDVPAVGFCVMVPEPPAIPEPLASEIEHAMDHPETLVRRERPLPLT